MIPRLSGVDVILWNQSKYILVSDIMDSTVRSLWRETPEGWSYTVGERCDFKHRLILMDVYDRTAMMLRYARWIHTVVR